MRPCKVLRTLCKDVWPHKPINMRSGSTPYINQWPRRICFSTYSLLDIFNSKIAYFVKLCTWLNEPGSDTSMQAVKSAFFFEKMNIYIFISNFYYTVRRKLVLERYMIFFLWNSVCTWKNKGYDVFTIHLEQLHYRL